MRPWAMEAGGPHVLEIEGPGYSKVVRDVLIGDVWAEPDLDEASWTPIAVPALWETQGYEDIDGVAWYRVYFDLTAHEAAAGVVLRLGQIGDTDRTWVNGAEVGGMEAANNRPRAYGVPASALREGRNVIAVRAEGESDTDSDFDRTPPENIAGVSPPL